MRPANRQLLGQLLDIAMRAQADPMHRVDADAIGTLTALIKETVAAPHVDGPRVVNDFSVALASMLLKLGVQGPWGDATEVARARKLIDVLVPMVREDLATALETEARAMPADQPETRRARWPS